MTMPGNNDLIVHTAYGLFAKPLEKILRQTGKPRPGVAGQPVLPHPQPGRTDGEVIGIL